MGNSSFSFCRVSSWLALFHEVIQTNSRYFPGSAGSPRIDPALGKGVAVLTSLFCHPALQAELRASPLVLHEGIVELRVSSLNSFENELDLFECRNVSEQGISCSMHPLPSLGDVL